MSAVDTDETKGRKVLRGKAKSLVVSVLEQVQALTQSLQVLLELEVPSEEDEEKQRTKMVIGLVDALKVADKTVGIALRDYSKALGELGKVPDDSLLANRGGKGEKKNT